MTEGYTLKVWRLHAQASRVIPAEKTLNGAANPAAVKWCGPYSTVNRLGWWLFPPVNVDITWHGDRFEHDLLQPYDDWDYRLLHTLLRPEDNSDTSKWCQPTGRTKFTWAAVEPNVVQIWSGLIFETPPGWCLHIRSPVNAPNPRQLIHVMEGVLETDWMQYDIWFNVVFDKPGEKVSLRTNGWPPLAHIIPMRRETAEAEWKLEEEYLNRNTPEGERVFSYWLQYNDKKFGHGGKQALTRDGQLTKDSTTYFRERHRILKGGMEPAPGNPVDNQTGPA